MKKLKNLPISNYLIIYLSGAVATLSLPPFSILPLTFALGFGIYLISLTPSLLKTFFAAWILGFGWFSIGLYWIGSAFIVADTYTIYFMPLAVVFLPSLLAVFWGIACVVAKLLDKDKKFPIINIIICLSLFEFLRANLFTGFPWLMPSMIFSSNTYLLQIFSFIGSFSTNLVVLTLSVLPIILLSRLNGKFVLITMLLIPMSVLIIFGIFRFNNKDLQKTNKQSITIVQPNIEQKNKWNLKQRDKHLNKLIMLSNNKDNFIDTNNIIIWPETSLAGSIPSEMKLLSDISKKVLKSPKSILVVGLLRTEAGSIYNSLVFVNSKGKIIHQYDKIKLVPFGEYIPFRKYLRPISEFLPLRDFSKGSRKSNFYIDGFGEIITLICYEILFVDEIINKMSTKTNLMINITNDAWFGKTVGPYQHLALAKIKSVEFGLPLVRVANTGISVFVSPYGEILSKIRLNRESVKTFNLTSPLGSTLYRTFGEYTFLLSILILIFINKLYNYNYGKVLSHEK